MMKIILLILLSICTLLNADHPRYKHRAPPHRRRSPPQQQFSKKWHQGGPLIQGIPQGIHKGIPQGIHKGIPHGLLQVMPQGIPQFPLRGPPIRQNQINHNHNNHLPMMLSAPTLQGPNKVPLGIPLMMQRPVTPPVRNFWKNPVNSVQFPPEKVFKPQRPSPPVEKQKPFRSAPSLPAQEFDFHIQTNQIPQTQINPIKQIGEKGPIHTIPAPNLSLKDKPLIVDEVRNEFSYQHNSPPRNNQEIIFQHGLPHEINFGQKIPQSSHVTIQKSHEYQVTEAPEHNQKLLRAQQEHQKQIQMQIQRQIEQMQKQTAQQEAQTQQIVLTSDAIPVQHSLDQNPTGDIILSNNLSPKDLYQLVQANYPQSQLEHIHLFQPEASYIEQFPQDQIPSEKNNFQPEYHSFNYDEQAHQKSLSKKDMSSLVSATYNLGTDPKEISSRNSEDPIMQSELIQNYYESRSDINENKLEADAKPSSKKESVDEKLLVGTYYSTLPNKEAAERLAQLQSAGKINSNLMKLSPESKEPMTILIPDENDEDDNSKSGSKEDNKEEFDDYGEEEESLASEESQEFGHRIQPKKRAE